MFNLLTKKNSKLIGLAVGVSLVVVSSACSNGNESASQEKKAAPVEQAAGATTAASVSTDQTTRDELSKEEAKKIVHDLMTGIVTIFQDSREQYNWNNYDNPADFSIFRPQLIEYASKNFTDGFLKETVSNYYCECDQRFFPDTNLDVRFTLHEVTNQKIVASGIEFINDMGDGGNTVYYTAIKENEKWVLDDIQWVAYEEEPINVTWEEIQAYEKQYDNQVELLNEVQHNGQKLYILRYPAFEQIKGVYANSTEILYEVPNELLPEEEQRKEGSQENQAITDEEPEVIQEEPHAEKVTPEQAEELVREHLGFTGQPDIYVVYDHDNDQHHYMIQVYKILDKGTEFAHNSTYGWYGVDPQTGEIYDAILGAN